MKILFIVQQKPQRKYLTSTGTGSGGPKTVEKMDERIFNGGTFRPTITSCSSLKQRTLAINCNTSNDLYEKS